jgi:hypothetical protein
MNVRCFPSNSRLPSTYSVGPFGFRIPQGQKDIALSVPPLSFYVRYAAARNNLFAEISCGGCCTIIKDRSFSERGLEFDVSFRSAAPSHPNVSSRWIEPQAVALHCHNPIEIFTIGLGERIRYRREVRESASPPSLFSWPTRPSCCSAHCDALRSQRRPAVQHSGPSAVRRGRFPRR